MLEANILNNTETRDSNAYINSLYYRTIVKSLQKHNSISEKYINRSKCKEYQLKNNKRIRKSLKHMSDERLFYNNMYIPALFGGDKDVPEVPFEITDTFENQDTKSLLYGKELTVYNKNIILSVLKELSESKTPTSSSRFSSNLQAKEQVHTFIRNLLKDPNMDFDKLKSAFKAHSIECMLAYALLAYQSEDDDLMLRTMYTFGRVLPLKEKNQWFDNYRLNAYGNVYNLTMYRDYVERIPETENNKVSLKHIYDVCIKREDINRRITIDPLLAKKFKIKLIGTLREHIIRNGLLPNKTNTSSLLTWSMLEENSKQLPAETKNMTDLDICDTCYNHFPFYYGGCHGCDCFDLGLTPTISELKLFLDRYPSARIGFILNTAMYKSGRGEHWMALMLMKGRALLMCSQQGTFNDFHDGGELKSNLEKNGFILECNNVKLQHDNHSCGMQSVIALMQMLRFGEIKSASDAIGADMSNLGSEIGKSSNTEKVIDKLAGTKT